MNLIIDEKVGTNLEYAILKIASYSVKITDGNVYIGFLE